MNESAPSESIQRLLDGLDDYLAGRLGVDEWTWTRSPLGPFVRELREDDAPELLRRVAEQFSSIRSTGPDDPQLRGTLVRWAEFFADLFVGAVSASRQEIADYAGQARMQILVDYLGDYAGGERWARVALEHVSDNAVHVMHGDAAISAIYSGDFDIAVQHLNSSIAGASRLRDAYSLAKYFGNLAVAQVNLGMTDAAVVSCDIALTIGDSLEQGFDLREKIEQDRAAIVSTAE